MINSLSLIFRSVAVFKKKKKPRKKYFAELAINFEAVNTKEKNNVNNVNIPHHGAKRSKPVSRHPEKPYSHSWGKNKTLARLGGCTGSPKHYCSPKQRSLKTERTQRPTGTPPNHTQERTVQFQRNCADALACWNSVDHSNQIPGETAQIHSLIQSLKHA